MKRSRRSMTLSKVQTRGNPSKWLRKQKKSRTHTGGLNLSRHTPIGQSLTLSNLRSSMSGSWKFATQVKWTRSAVIVSKTNQIEWTSSWAPFFAKNAVSSTRPLSRCSRRSKPSMKYLIQLRWSCCNSHRAINPSMNTLLSTHWKTCRFGKNTILMALPGTTRIFGMRSAALATKLKCPRETIRKRSFATRMLVLRNLTRGWSKLNLQWKISTINTKSRLKLLRSMIRQRLSSPGYSRRKL